MKETMEMLETFKSNLTWAFDLRKNLRSGSRLFFWNEKTAMTRPRELARQLREDGPFNRDQARRLATLKSWMEESGQPIDIWHVTQFLAENEEISREMAEAVAQVARAFQRGQVVETRGRRILPERTKGENNAGDMQDSLS